MPDPQRSELATPGASSAPSRAANEMNEIVECYATTGRGSHMLVIQTKNTQSLEKLLRKIHFLVAGYILRIRMGLSWMKDFKSF